MDFKLVRKLAVDKLWDPEEPRGGVGYQNLWKQVTAFVGHLQEEDSPLQWLPLELMSEQNVADIVVSFYNRDGKDRLMLHSLSYLGLRHTYAAFRGDNEKDLQTSRMIMGDFVHEYRESEAVCATILTEGMLKSRDLLFFCKKDRESFADVLDQLLEILEEGQCALYEEKNCAKAMGLYIYNPNSINRFMDLVDMVVSQVLLFLILKYQGSREKGQILSALGAYVRDVLTPGIERGIEEAKESFAAALEKGASFQQSTSFWQGMIAPFFTCWLSRRAYYVEREKINTLLVEEVGSAPERFAPPPKTSCDEIVALKSRELRAALCEGMQVHEYPRKLKDTKDLLDLGAEHKNLRADSSRVAMVRPVFREVFLEKMTYRDRQAMRIARRLLEGEPIEQHHQLFLDLKILRGVFREHGLMEEYKLYCGLMQDVRRLILLSYRGFVDISIHNLTFQIGHNVLGALLEPRVCGIHI